MLTLEAVKDWLKTIQPSFERYYVGKLDGKKDNSLGVYDLKRAKKYKSFKQTNIITHTWHQK